MKEGIFAACFKALDELVEREEKALDKARNTDGYSFHCGRVAGVYAAITVLLKCERGAMKCE